MKTRTKETNVKRFPMSGGRLLAGLGMALIAARAYGLDLTIESEMNIFEQDSGPWSGGHAATIVQTTKGTIIAAWRRDVDKVPNNQAWMSTFVGGKWTTPRVIASGNEVGKDHTLENVCLFQPRNGPLLLFYYAGPNRFFDRENKNCGGENMWGVLKTSNDDGKTWSAPAALGNDARIAGGRLCGPTKNPPIQLPDGTILIPSSNEPGLQDTKQWEKLTWHFEKSTDLGKTWSLVQVLPVNPFKTIQPGILTLGGGKLLALGRNEGKGNDTPMATSSDWGKTWSGISGLAALPQSHSGIAPLTLSDGTHICILNKPVPGGPARDQLDLMTSANGTDWTLGLTLNPAGDGKVANYPQVIQAADGKLHVVFTYAKEQNFQTWKERVIRHIVVKTTSAVQAPAPLAAWSFLKRDGRQVTTAPASSAPNIAALEISRGPGLFTRGSNDSMQGDGWTTASEIDPNDYFQFGLTVADGHRADLTKLLFTARRNLYGPKTIELRSSRDDYAATIAKFSTPPDKNVDYVVDLATTFTNVSGTLTFRLFGYDSAPQQTNCALKLFNFGFRDGLGIKGAPMRIEGTVR